MSDLVMNRLVVVEGAPSALSPYIAVSRDGHRLSFSKIHPPPPGLSPIPDLWADTLCLLWVCAGRMKLDEVDGLSPGIIRLLRQKVTRWRDKNPGDSAGEVTAAANALADEDRSGAATAKRYLRDWNQTGARHLPHWRAQNWGCERESESIAAIPTDGGSLVYQTTGRLPRPIYERLANILPLHRLVIGAHSWGTPGRAIFLLSEGQCREAWPPAPSGPLRVALEAKSSEPLLRLAGV